MTRILIADDHEMIRSGLRAVLEGHAGWSIAAEAADGREAVARAVQTRPDVAIVDYLLPMLNGLEVTRQIRQQVPSTEVLIFTLHDEDALVPQILDAGARGFVLKTQANEHLVSAVAALAAHNPYIAKAMPGRADADLQPASAPSIPRLTPRERIVVQLIAEGHSNQAMANILSLSVKTIETHRASAIAKIGANSTAGVVRYAIRNRLVSP